MSGIYADVGRSAASISLRLYRLAEGRGTKNDRATLESVGKELSRIARGELETESPDPLFSKVEGLYVVYAAAKEWPELSPQKDKKGRECLLMFSEKMAEAVSAPEGNSSSTVDDLKAFFRAVHDLAEELTVTGPKIDPVGWLSSQVLA